MLLLLLFLLLLLRIAGGPCKHGEFDLVVFIVVVVVIGLALGVVPATEFHVQGAVGDRGCGIRVAVQQLFHLHKEFQTGQVDCKDEFVNGGRQRAVVGGGDVVDVLPVVKSELDLDEFFEIQVGHVDQSLQLVFALVGDGVQSDVVAL